MLTTLSCACLAAAAVLQEDADPALLRKAVLTGLFVVALLAGRGLALHWLRGLKLEEDLRLRWKLRITQAAGLLLLVALVFIWAPELRSLALSAVAIAAAIVIGAKELIMCLTGSMLRARGQSYAIGDRIEVSTFRGDVIDYGLITTTLLEIGSAHQQTGRAIVFPNSLLLTVPVVNETFTDEYVLHRFAVPLAPGEDWEWAEGVLLEAAARAVQPYVQAAQRHIDRTAREHGLNPPSTEPRVSIQLDAGDSVVLLVRVPVPARRKGAVEQGILRDFLQARKQRSADPGAAAGGAGSQA